MSLNLEEKKAVVAEVSAEVAGAQTVVVAEYRGITVENMTQLRAQARKEGVYLRVLKNTLVRRAVADTPFAGIADQLVGPLAYGISKDPVAAAKVMHEFAKTNDKFVIKAGAMPNFIVQALGHHAGPDRAIRSHAQRSADQVRSRTGCCARQAGCLTHWVGADRRHPNRRYCF